jgi:hypothetical protein
MSVAVKAEVFGIQETLAELNKIDPIFRRQITKDIQSGAGRMVVQSARSMIPTDYPLSGMARGSMIKGRNETIYNIKRVADGVKTIVGKRASRERTVTFNRPLIMDGRRVNNAYTQTIDFKARPYALLVAQQKDAAAALWDHAGIRDGSQFVTNLIAEGEGPNPRASRSLTPGVDAAMPGVEGELSKIVDRVSVKMNKNLKIEYR